MNKEYCVKNGKIVVKNERGKVLSSKKGITDIEQLVAENAVEEMDIQKTFLDQQESQIGEKIKENKIFLRNIWVAVFVAAIFTSPFIGLIAGLPFDDLPGLIRIATPIGCVCGITLGAACSIITVARNHRLQKEKEIISMKKEVLEKIKTTAIFQTKKENNQPLQEHDTYREVPDKAVLTNLRRLLILVEDFTNHRQEYRQYFEQGEIFWKKLSEKYSPEEIHIIEDLLYSEVSEIPSLNYDHIAGYSYVKKRGGFYE